MSLILASNNQHKVTEIRKILPKCFDLVSLKDAGITTELPETKGTIIGNATQKASFVWEATGVECLADDSGLEVDALEGRPGVDSAHYSGFPISADRNMDLLLSQLHGLENRRASFVTILALIKDGVCRHFEGRVFGTISEQKRGENGFGYDPIFIPDGQLLTFAEMDDKMKNEISHRSIALRKLKAFFDLKEGN
ncbi:MAG: RdgB/HAM1 family non-canonical purine NTP pyrophosphatase [Bacteroidetes bacterium]|nr:RdgB/HAM1 family non-canonical purine NTP pyrophosphatase [Bacteroidota bacterium]